MQKRPTQRWLPLLFVVCVCAGCARTGAQTTVRAPNDPGEMAAALARVHFPTARASVVVRDRGVLVSNAEWLRAHPEAVVVLEGHCDERGGDAVNLELGDRRARAVMGELAGAGVGTNLMIVVSQGKRAPLDARHSPAAWARNRRVEFVVR